MVFGLSEGRAGQRNEYRVATTCLRCGGLMVSDVGFDLEVQRCVQCGERVDSVILQNRQQPAAFDR